MNGLYALLIFSPSPYLAMTIQCLTAWRFPSYSQQSWSDRLSSIIKIALPPFGVLFPPARFLIETWGYGYSDKIARVRLLICTYLSYACRCILLKLSVDPSSLKWSYQMVPLSLDFSSTACNITVTSNAHRCALELHFSLESLVRIMHTQDRY